MNADQMFKTTQFIGNTDSNEPFRILANI
uniref:Uncharacterized protein n=1 Tax=Anguilla anguilla TaxID=7936 RepID=A0A0E9VLR4_ANGAN